MSRFSSLHMHHWFLGVLLAAVAGCTAPVVMDGNYLTYEHAFTQAAADKVEKNAKEICEIGRAHV